MKITVDTDKLRKSAIMIATPMYGGQNYASYNQSLNDLLVKSARMGLIVKPHILSNESLITRARNYCADAFLNEIIPEIKNAEGEIIREESHFTHLLFLDSDIGFDANYVFTMLALMLNNPDEYNIMCAPYQKKEIAWEKVKQAVDAGVADEDPRVLSKYVGDFVFNTTKPIKSLDEPAEISEGGTGFMMISRDTLLKFKESYPEYMYKPDHVRSKNFDGSKEIMMFFQADIDPESKRYLSEDYWFCQKARKIGMKVWLCPWMHLTHTGTYMFAGSLAHTLSLGMTPTADPKKIKK